MSFVVVPSPGASNQFHTEEVDYVPTLKEGDFVIFDKETYHIVKTCQVHDADTLKTIFVYYMTPTDDESVRDVVPYTF